MRAGILLALLLLAVPVAAASAETIDRPVNAEVIQPQVVADAPTAPAMQLDLVQAKQHAPAMPADAVMQEPRAWSFWWIVGVLVVAGVILAVVT